MKIDFALIAQIIHEIETVYLAASGEDKLEAAVDAIDKITNTGAFDPIDRPIIKVIVKAVVATYNRIYGHIWPKVTPEVIKPPEVAVQP